VDAFFTAFALEHIRNYRKAFSEMERALKPGGRMLIVVPFLYYYHGAPDDYVRPLHGKPRSFCF
jgi:ubiquinone/menaquinone biosynthesis C-methylase UbiE